MGVGVCPNCLEAVSIPKKGLYFQCPNCKEQFPVSQAVSLLNTMCLDPTNADDILDMCLDLEESGEEELALGIIEILKDTQPQDEQLAFTFVRLSGYEPMTVKHYLESFAGAKGIKPFAEDFLESAMEPRNLASIGLLYKYIENKLPAARQKAFKERLEMIKSEYVGTNVAEGVKFMYIYYIVCTVINLALIVVLFVVKLMLVFNILIGISMFCIELLILFFHNKIYGNRIGINVTERILLTIFLSSIPAAIAGIIIAGLV